MAKKRRKFIDYKIPNNYPSRGTGIVDVLGSYTGYTVFLEEPEQDADDL